MLRSVIARQEGRHLGAMRVKEQERQSEPMVRVKEVLGEVTRQAKGYINGTIRLLQGPYQSSPTGEALKALHG